MIDRCLSLMVHERHVNSWRQAVAGPLVCTTAFWSAGYVFIPEDLQYMSVGYFLVDFCFLGCSTVGGGV